MNVFAYIMPLALDAAGRWNSAGRWFRTKQTDFEIGTWAACAAAGLVLVLVVWRVWKYRKELAWRRFNDSAGKAGLNRDERDILMYLVRTDAKQAVNKVFQSEQMMRQCVEKLFGSDQFKTLSPTARIKTTELVESICRKLNFEHAYQNSKVTSRHLPEGVPLSIMSYAEGDKVDARVEAVRETGFVLVPASPFATQVGEIILVVYATEGVIWEFDAEVSQVEPGKVTLKHSDHIRFINRRRFARIPVLREILVAPMPFVTNGSKLAAPAFVGGKMTELAGPGFLLEVPGEYRAGDRLVVIIQMENDLTVQCVVKIRRSTPAGALCKLGVEALDLGGDEIAVLVRETNVAQHEKHLPDKQYESGKADSARKASWATTSA